LLCAVKLKTMKDIKAQLKWIYKLISDLQNSKIHYSQSTSWTRQNDEGYNDGIQLGISQLEKRAKYLERKLKSEVSV